MSERMDKNPESLPEEALEGVNGGVTNYQYTRDINGAISGWFYFDDYSAAPDKSGMVGRDSFMENGASATSAQASARVRIKGTAMETIPRH